MSEAKKTEETREEKERKEARANARELHFFRFYYVVLKAVLCTVLYPLKVSGRENIPEGGALVCANHSAAIDPFFVSFSLGMRYPVAAMAKESIMKIPVVGFLLKLIGTFPVRRGESDMHAVRFAMERVKQGRYVIVFPEGHRVKSRAEGEPKTGAVMMACRTGKPVVPVYVTTKKRPFRWNVVRIGKPLTFERPKGRGTMEAYEEMTAALMDAIYAMGDDE